jgi:DNA invertase Pin-like site-specific DNA recombinase
VLWITYARVSTIDQARDGCSMEVQRDATSAMLKALGHQRGESI